MEQHVFELSLITEGRAEKGAQISCNWFIKLSAENAYNLTLYPIT